MIPAYKEKIEVKKLVESNEPMPLRAVLAALEGQITQLRESVNYLQRENSRLKSDVSTLAQAIQKR